MEKLNFETIVIGDVDVEGVRRHFEEFCDQVRDENPYIPDGTLFEHYYSQVLRPKSSRKLDDYIEAFAELMTIISEDFIWPDELEYPVRDKLFEVDTNNPTARAIRSGFFFTMYHVQRALFDKGVFKVTPRYMLLSGQKEIMRRRSEGIGENLEFAIAVKNSALENFYSIPQSLQDVIAEFSGVMDTSDIRSESVKLGSSLAMRILQDAYKGHIDRVHKVRQQFIDEEFNSLVKDIVPE